MSNQAKQSTPILNAIRNAIRLRMDTMHYQAYRLQPHQQMERIWLRQEILADLFEVMNSAIQETKSMPDGKDEGPK